jgi:hypothetical protein
MMLIREKCGALVRSVRRFHTEERGSEAIQTIIVLAVAAIALMGVNNLVTGNGAEGDSSGGLLGSVGGMISGVLGGSTSVFGGIGDILGGLF